MKRAINFLSSITVILTFIVLLSTQVYACSCIPEKEYIKENVENSYISKVLVNKIEIIETDTVDSGEGQVDRVVEKISFDTLKDLYGDKSGDVDEVTVKYTRNSVGRVECMDQCDSFVNETIGLGDIKEGNEYILFIQKEPEEGFREIYGVMLVGDNKLVEDYVGYESGMEYEEVLNDLVGESIFTEEQDSDSDGISNFLIGGGIAIGAGTLAVLIFNRKRIGKMIRR